MPELPYRRPWLFEFHDQPWFPDHLRQHTQNLLTFLWVTWLPPFQLKAPYVAASDILDRVIRDIEAEDLLVQRQSGETMEGLRVVDCCSGAGGPVPALEQKIK